MLAANLDADIERLRALLVDEGEGDGDAAAVSSGGQHGGVAV